MTPKTLILCDCLGSQTLDAEALSNATGLRVPKPCSALCTTQIDRAADALREGNALIACGQEAERFVALAEELGVPSAAAVDLRDRTGWTADPASALPKMSALIAEALLPAVPDKTIDVVSEGTCLILGSGNGQSDVALAAAASLAPYLHVTVLLDADPEVPPQRDVDIVPGNLRSASGALGAFDLRIDRFCQREPGGRGGPAFTAPRDGARSVCDVILDLRGGTPLFPAPEKREGYLRADPSHAPSIAAAIMAASHLVGTFEQTLYVATEPLLCAHSRAEQTGCTRCLDLCPTGAITPAGDHVTVDPMICAGCGACSAVCPSGAIRYDAPPVEEVFRRVQILAKAYLDAGGARPRLLVVTDHGAEMIRLAARYGRGLPADVIPLEIAALNTFGHAEMLAARAAGFTTVTLVPGPKADRQALDAQIDLARAVAGAGSILVCETSDPDGVSDMLFDAPEHEPEHESVATPVRPLGTRRQIARAAAKALQPDMSQIALPDGAPYGAVLVDTDACTLCLSCVSLCPSGALGDNPDKPQLRFQEDACLQCGICVSVCPEDAITLEPRFDLTDAALRQTVLNEEEPAACIECGALFGSKSTIARITEKLRDHAMFSGEKLRMIQMCDDCRVNAQFHSENNPFQGKERPKPRTSDDYFSKRRDH